MQGISGLSMKMYRVPVQGSDSINFTNDIAVGTGTGLRFDFSFVTARLDMGHETS